MIQESSGEQAGEAQALAGADLLAPREAYHSNPRPEAAFTDCAAYNSITENELRNAEDEAPGEHGDEWTVVEGRVLVGRQGDFGASSVDPEMRDYLAGSLKRRSLMRHVFFVEDPI